MDWHEIPPEIRFQILQEVDDHQSLHGVADSQRLQADSGSKTPDRSSTTRLAIVCKEWQNFFEHVIFRRLRLDQSRLENLKTLIAARPSRMAAIQKIFYRVKLVRYECPSCRDEASEVGKKRNNDAFLSQLLDLLGMLSTWEASTGNGISLSLLVVSPNENGQHSWYDPQDEDSHPFLFGEDVQNVQALKDFHSSVIPRKEKGCMCVFRDPRVHLNFASDALIELDSSSIADLPTVHVVKELVIRRSRHRCIAVASVAQIVSRSFVDLRSFMYEHTVKYTRDSRERPRLRSQELNEDLVHHLPHTLRHLSITDWTEFGIRTDSDGDNGLAGALASGHVFQHLTEFGASGSVCADTLLGHLASVPLMGERLELLSLRADSFSFRQPDQAILKTIRAPAAALPHLPKLRMMELWGARKMNAECTFRYRIDQTTKRPSITWIAPTNAPSELDDFTIACWLDTNARLGRHPLTINNERSKGGWSLLPTGGTRDYQCCKVLSYHDSSFTLLRWLGLRLIQRNIKRARRYVLEGLVR